MYVISFCANDNTRAYKCAPTEFSHSAHLCWRARTRERKVLCVVFRSVCGSMHTCKHYSLRLCVCVCVRPCLQTHSLRNNRWLRTMQLFIPERFFQYSLKLFSQLFNHVKGKRSFLLQDHITVWLKHHGFFFFFGSDLSKRVWKLVFFKPEHNFNPKCQIFMWVQGMNESHRTYKDF